MTSMATFAQLSGAETISYIQKKMIETAELRRIFNSSLSYQPVELVFGYDAASKDKLILGYKRKFSNNNSDELQYIFDPSHISSVDLYVDTVAQVVGMVDIKFIGKTVIFRQRTNGEVKDVSQSAFLIPFLKIDPLNFQRLKMALFHLKEIYAGKKGPDPFAN